MQRLKNFVSSLAILKLCLCCPLVTRSGAAAQRQGDELTGRQSLMYLYLQEGLRVASSFSAAGSRLF